MRIRSTLVRAGIVVVRAGIVVALAGIVVALAAGVGTTFSAAQAGASGGATNRDQVAEDPLGPDNTQTKHLAQG
jgi:hypothetical protein